MNNVKVTHLYPPLGNRFIVFSVGYNFYIIWDIKFKFSAILSLVKVTKCVKFQISMYKGVNVVIFRISPIDLIAIAQWSLRAF